MRLALLDLDGTLFDRAHAFELSVTLWSRELDLEPDDFVPFVVKADNDGLSGWPHWIHEAQQRFGFRGDVDQLIIEQWERYLSVIPLATSSIEGLWCLRDSGWRTVIVTNGSASQLDIARQCGVLDAVDECIVSGMVGVRKPELAIFEIAADSVNQALDARSTWMGKMASELVNVPTQEVVTCNPTN